MTTFTRRYGTGMEKGETPMDFGCVLLDVTEQIGVITLNRPHRLNAIVPELLDGLISALELCRKDPDVRSVILTGAGKSFCAGEDLKETAAGKDLAQWVKEAEGLQDSQRAILRLGKPMIAAVKGYAVGGGLEFAMGCDIRISGQTGRFGFPETGVGLTVTNAGTKLATHLLGLGKAKELIFTGEIIDAQTAMNLGLVNHVVEDERLMKEAVELCRKINRNSPAALKFSRIAIDRGLSMGFEEILELEVGHLLACAATGSADSFVKRKARAIGKKEE